MIFNVPTKYHVEALLKMAGYKKQDNGSYMYYDGIGGRFHAYLHTPRTADIHYDLFVKGNSGAHFSPKMPTKHREERKRLNRICIESLEDKLEKKEMLYSIKNFKHSEKQKHSALYPILKNENPMGFWQKLIKFLTFKRKRNVTKKLIKNT